MYHNDLNDFLSRTSDPLSETLEMMAKPTLFQNEFNDIARHSTPERMKRAHRKWR